MGLRMKSCWSSIRSCWARGSASLRREPRHAHSSSSARQTTPSGIILTTYKVAGPLKTGIGRAGTRMPGRLRSGGDHAEVAATQCEGSQDRAMGVHLEEQPSWIRCGPRAAVAPAVASLDARDAPVRLSSVGPLLELSIAMWITFPAAPPCLPHGRESKVLMRLSESAPGGVEVATSGPSASRRSSSIAAASLGWGVTSARP